MKTKTPASVIGVKKDLTEAAYWLKRGTRGSQKAQYELGNYYYNGEGVKKDEKKAAEWWLKAANQGHSKAELEILAISYNC